MKHNSRKHFISYKWTPWTWTLRGPAQALPWGRQFKALWRGTVPGPVFGWMKLTWETIGFEMQRKLMAVCQWDGETRAKGKCPFSECTVCMSQVHIGWLVCVCKSPITMPAATFKTPLGSCTCFIKQFECKWIYSIDPFIRDWFRWYMWHYWSNSIWEPPGNSFRFQTSPACLCNSCTITFTHNTKLWRQWIDFNNNLYKTTPLATNGTMYVVNQRWRINMYYWG